MRAQPHTRATRWWVRRLTAVWQPEQHVVWYALLLGTLTLTCDYFAGPYIRFPIFFVLPVIFVSWYHGGRLGLCFAVLLPTARFGLYWYWDVEIEWTALHAMANTVSYIIVLSIMVYLTTRAAREHRGLQEQVRVLSGILPICGFCKKIRDQHGQWQVLEAYIMNHSEAKFSHGLCPTCMQEHYRDYLDAPEAPPQAT